MSTTDASIHNTTVDLDGLLEVLGKNLYSTPSVALRELIQNANDACQRRTIEDQSVHIQNGDHQFKIKLSVNAAEKSLTIADNGSGLTDSEIREFLATIGSGYSRVIRNGSGSDDIIGYFGLGFLSAYVVSHKVEVTTLSYQTPELAWKFSSAKGKTFTISPGSREDVGTTVKLYLDEDYYVLAQRDYLRELIRRYCGLLPLDIQFSDESEVINNRQIPWLLPDNVPDIRRRKVALEFASNFERSFEPLAVFNIPNDNPLGLKGLIWVQDGSSYASSDNRNISVFCRRMFISEDEKSLLPRWAGFCGGVVDSAKFLPTASRESLQKNEYFDEVREYLSEFLATELRRVVVQEPGVWKSVLLRHGQSLLSAAIADDRLFDTMHKSLKVPTTDGELTIAQILAKSKNQIVIKMGAEPGHEEILYRARGIPLVKGYLRGAATFCDKYKALVGAQVEVLGTRESQQNVFTPRTPDNKGDEAIYTALFEGADTRVAFTQFQPASVPLVIMEDHNVIVKRRIEDDQADRRIAGGILSLARIGTAQTTQEKSRTVFLNLNNGMVSQLPNMPPSDREQAANLLASLMEFLSLSPAQQNRGVEESFDLFNAALSHFMSK